MRRLLGFFIGLLVGIGLTSFAFKYHVVYCADGLILVPKKPASLASPYVDVRKWKPADWQSHPEVAHSVMAHGRSDLLGAPANEFVRDLLRKVGRSETLDDPRME